MSTLTPNYGLIVPEATDNIAQVRADYATNLGKIDNIQGGGGGGGGNVYGAFINTNDIIASGTYTGSFSYTATKDCYFYGEIANNSNTTATMTVDGKTIIQNYDSSISQNGCVVPLRKGQIIALTTTFAQAVTTYTVYGLTQGTESIFTPIIYSDNERMIGIWRDNKPLYQRTWTGTKSTTTDEAVISGLTTLETLVDARVIFKGNTGAQIAQYFRDVSDFGRCWYDNNEVRMDLGSSYPIRPVTWSITLWYTKTTDTAGSGNWNTDGIPMVHYSTTEQVIGTYLGQTLYQKTFILPSTINVSYTSWSDMGVSVANGEKVVGCFGIATDGTHSQLMAYFNSDVVMCQSARNGNPSYNVQEITIQYTKSS